MTDEEIEQVVITSEEDNSVIVQEEEETAVVDNGQTYESTESAIIARDEARKAKLWAEESERQANLSSESALDAANSRDIAENAKEVAQESAETAEFYAKNIKFGMVKELFTTSDWVQENNIYYIEYNYNIVSGVYKQNQTNYELMTNIDVKDLGDKVRIYSIERFAGFVLLVNSAENSVRWGNIGGDITTQTDLQNALDNKADISDIPTKTSDLTNDSGFITGITGSDVVSALGYTPYDSTNPSGFITNSALVGYATENYVDTGLNGKQDTLISGTNIKTINNTSILGSGNIDIQTGGNYTAGTGIDITNDVISVTNAISTGAALGATALQPSALNGYATQAWVGQQGYITGITSSDVTTALGYTPYNATNPAGYTSNIGTVTSVNNIQPGTNGNVTITIPDTTQLNYYGTCATAAATQAKVVVCPDFTELKEGVSIRVNFANAQYYNGAPTLNVNSTGAKSVKSLGTGLNAVRYCWLAGEVVSFTYDGTNWIMEDAGLANTSYYGYTKLMTSATSASASLALTPVSLNDLVQNMIEPYPVYSASATYEVGDRVRYDYQAWECNTAITTAEEWNANHWTALDPIQTQIDGKQDTLVSGTNIKTINNQSLLGSGNIDIQGGGSDVEAFTAAEVQTIWDNVNG